MSNHDKRSNLYTHIQRQTVSVVEALEQIEILDIRTGNSIYSWIKNIARLSLSEEQVSALLGHEGARESCVHLWLMSESSLMFKHLYSILKRI
jgi:hypothetical protein